MTESNQGPATPGTAARCEVRCDVCGWPYVGGLSVCFRDALAEIMHWKIGYERLKAANASLLEQIENWRLSFNMKSEEFAAETRRSSEQWERAERAEKALHDLQLQFPSAEQRQAWASAEQRAEAAEKEVALERSRHIAANGDWRAAEQRNTELEGALRGLVEAIDFISDTGTQLADEDDALTAARAALHDEERSAPQEEGEDGK